MHAAIFVPGVTWMSMRTNESGELASLVLSFKQAGGWPIHRIKRRERHALLPAGI
jgi:hypothetical protein